MDVFELNEGNKQPFHELLCKVLGERYEIWGFKDIVCYGLMDEGEFCGFISISQSGTMANIDCIYILSHLRHRHYGSRLLKDAELFLEVAGFEGICAVLVSSRETGENQYGNTAFFVREFFEGNGYLLTEVDNELIDTSDELEVLYGVKMF